MPLVGVFKHLLREDPYDTFLKGLGLFWGKLQEQGVQMAAGAIKKTLEDARHLVVPYFQKLSVSGKTGAQTAAENFFRNQRERQECKPRWNGRSHRPGDENRFMTLVAKFYLAMDPKPMPVTINMNVGKGGKPTDQIVRETLAELQKGLQAFLMAQAVAGGARTPEEERDKFFIWLFNESDEKIEAILAAVDHDPVRQFARRVGQDIVESPPAQVVSAVAGMTLNALNDAASEAASGINEVNLNLVAFRDAARKWARR